MSTQRSSREKYPALIMHAAAVIVMIVMNAKPSISASFIGIKKFEIDLAATDYYQSMDILLFQRLNFELLPRGIKPILIEDTIPQECVSVVRGSIVLLDSIPLLLLKISGPQKEEEIKKIPLIGEPVDAIIDIMVLKVRSFLEQNLSGKLRISSSPLDCDILLNGVKIGKTPAELVLEQGNYFIQLQREHLLPFKDSVTIQPGHETSLSAAMRFEGRRIRPWTVTAAILTGCMIAAQVLEIKFKDGYHDLREAPDDRWDRAFQRYQAANAAKISFLIPSATAWIIAGYHFQENRSLKRRIFGSNGIN